MSRAVWSSGSDQPDLVPHEGAHPTPLVPIVVSLRFEPL